MVKELISVIIPVYNCENYITRCIKSLCNQKYQNIEIVIVDDGSTDKTLQYIEQVATVDSRIIYFTKKNEGVSVARNFGLQNARGKYISFVDADDYVDIDYIETLYDLMLKYNADIIFCDYYEEKENCTINTKKEKDIKAPICFSVENGFNYMSVDYSYCLVWGALYKKEIINNISFEKNIYVAEDSLFFLQAAEKARNIVHIYNKLYHYVQYEESACRGKFNMKKYTELEAWKQICDKVKSLPEVYSSARAGYAITCRAMIIKYYKDPLFRKKYYKELMKEYIFNLRYVIWKTKNVLWTKKMMAIGFVICPAIYIMFKTMRDK